jgi:glycolate oxidase iron-sulfur subunit
MDALNQGTIPLAAPTIAHFDTCLGCLACVSSCPSGVAYDQLISATRPQIERNYTRPLADRLIRSLIFSLFPYPKRLRVLLAPLVPYQKLGLSKVVRPVLKKVAPRLAAMESMLPTIPPGAFREQLPEVIPAQGTKRYRVGVILGCVQRLFFPQVNEATVRVLTANGCEVVIPPTQGCCAALPQHQGQTQQAETLARQMIDSFRDSNVDAVIINAAGCGHTLKEYGHILQDDLQYREQAQQFAAKVRDIHEFLWQIGLTAQLQPLTAQPLALVYQDACHLLHGQRISLQPRQLLGKIPGVELREPIDAAVCCGSSGVYKLLQPEIAEELGEQKVRNLLNTGATLIASPNPGCALQIQKHLGERKIPVFHPIELLDRSLRGIGLS